MAIFLEVYHIYRLPHGPPTQGGDRLPGMLRPPGRKANTAARHTHLGTTEMHRVCCGMLLYVIILCYYIYVIHENNTGYIMLYLFMKSKLNLKID